MCERDCVIQYMCSFSLSPALWPSLLRFFLLYPLVGHLVSVIGHIVKNIGIWAAASAESRANWSSRMVLFGKVHGCYSYSPQAWKELMPSDSSGAIRGGLDRKWSEREERERVGWRGVLNERGIRDDLDIVKVGMRNIGGEGLKRRYCRISIVPCCLWELSLFMGQIF